MKEVIKKGINENRELLNLRDEIVKFKNQKGTKEGGIKMLDELRIEFKDDEEKEDRILELLDFATGWYQVRYRIWD